MYFFIDISIRCCVYLVQYTGTLLFIPCILYKGSWFMYPEQPFASYYAAHHIIDTFSTQKRNSSTSCWTSATS